MTPQPPDLTLWRHDCFGRLPPEINVEIMGLLRPKDLSSLVRASPVSWSNFQMNHECIVQPHLEHIYNYYGDLRATFPFFKTLTRLRSLALDGKRAAVVERNLKSFIDSSFPLELIELPSSWKTNLPIIVALTNLISEIYGAFQQGKSTTPVPECDPWALWTLWSPILLRYGVPARISPEETWRFVNTFIGYECFCSTSYHPEGFLWRDMPNLRDYFSKVFTASKAVVPSEAGDSLSDWHGRFHPPDYFYRQGRVIVSTVDKHLRLLWPKHNKKLKKSQDQSHIGRFLNRTNRQNEYFCRHLSLQGNAMREYLLSLSSQDLSDCILQQYFLVISPRAKDEPKVLPYLREIVHVARNWE